MLTWLLAAVLAAAAPAPSAPSAQPPMLATIPGTVQFDLPSTITGRTYRIYVAKPLLPPPKAGYPVVYVTDGDTAFGAAAAQMTLGLTGSLKPGLIVAVAYPGANALQSMTLRTRDLTPSQPDAASAALSLTPPKAEDYAGSPGFYRFLREELAPVIRSRFPTDPADTTLMGYSLGGLFALHALFEHPQDFRSYVIGSPSIWWNGREVLQEEASFAEAVRAGRAAPRVLITSGAWEQDDHMIPPGAPDRERMRGLVQQARMVDNARDLATRLQALKGASGYEVRYFVFADETHNSGSVAATARGVSFALEK